MHPAGLGCVVPALSSACVGEEADFDENKSLFLVGIILSRIIFCTGSLCGPKS